MVSGSLYRLHELAFRTQYAELKERTLAAGPLLLASLVTGLLVSIFQAATQINEMTLSFIPKLLIMFIVLVVTGP